MGKLTGADILSGLFFVSLGALGVVLSFEEKIGTATRMGPGYMPLVLSICLIVLGGIVLLRGVLAGEPAIQLGELRPPLMILLSVAAFALSVRSLGLAPAVFITVFISSFAQTKPRLAETGLLALAMALFCSAVFVWALGLTIPVFLP